jgi:hypothetical protein
MASASNFVRVPVFVVHVLAPCSAASLALASVSFRAKVVDHPPAIALGFLERRPVSRNTERNVPNEGLRIRSGQLVIGHEASACEGHQQRAGRLIQPGLVGSNAINRFGKLTDNVSMFRAHRFRKAGHRPTGVSPGRVCHPAGHFDLPGISYRFLGTPENCHVLIRSLRRAPFSPFGRTLTFTRAHHSFSMQSLTPP